MRPVSKDAGRFLFVVASTARLGYEPAPMKLKIHRVIAVCPPEVWDVLCQSPRMLKAVLSVF